MRYRLAAIGAALSVWAGASFAQDDITLRFPDGSFEVSGPLLGFDGLAYRLDTRFGVLTLSARTVECVSGCPGPDDVPSVRIIGSASMGDVLMPALIDSFAISLGLRSAVEATETGLVVTLLSSPDQPLARFEVSGDTAADGFAALIEHRADIVMSDRPATQAEIEAVRDASLGQLTDPQRRRLIARQ